MPECNLTVFDIARILQRRGFEMRNAEPLNNHP
jgi:hypothetical protein